MRYVFTGAAIASKRIDRRSSKQKKIARENAEKKRLRLQEYFSVAQLLEMGFYESSDRDRPYGVEVTQTQKEVMDKDWHELRCLSFYRITLLPPDGASLHGIDRFAPSLWREADAFSWKYRIFGNAILWVIFDLMSRIIDLPCWQKCDRIPLLWKVGNEATLTKAKKVIETINNENEGFSLSMPALPVIENLAEVTRNHLLLSFPSSTIHEISDRAILSFLRHTYTPYDYLWQTNRMDRDEARSLCNELVLKKYPQISAVE